MINAILRFPDVQALTGFPRSTLYSRIAIGLFTKSVKISRRTAGWPSREVDALNAARIAGKSDEQIRALVRKLEAMRTKGNGGKQ
jgi:prophage regulatory protein